MAQASAKKLKHTGPSEKERVVSVPQSKQLASAPEPSLSKEQSRLSKAPNREVGERIKVGESRTLVRERGDQSSSKEKIG